VLRTEDFTTEAGDAVLAKLDHRQELRLAQTFDFGRDRLLFHVDDVGRTYHIANAAAGAFFELNAFDHVAS
jgi:hypothetical protein